MSKVFRAASAQELRLSNHTGILPFAAALVVVALFAGAWDLIREDQALRLKSEISGHATHIAARLEAHIATRLAIGVHLGHDLADLNIVTESGFRQMTRSPHELFPDIQAINWVSSERIIRWVSPLKGNEAAIGLDINKLPIPNATLDEAVRTGSYRVTAPIELAQGGRGFVAYIPLHPDRGPGGFLNIVFRTAPLIEATISNDVSDRFSAVISDGEASVYGEGGAADASRTSPQPTIKVGNRVWSLSVIPTPQTLRMHASIVDEMVLIAGLLLSLAVGLLLRFALLRQQSVRRSERRFRDIATVSSDWFWEMDDNLRFTYISERYDVVTGVSSDYRIGLKREELVDEDQLKTEEWAGHFADLAARRPFKDFEYVVTVPQGKTLHLRVSGVPVFDASGQFTGYRGSATNITDEKFAISALRGAEDKLRDILDNTPVGIAIVNHPSDTANTMPGQRVFANRALIDMFRASSAEQLLTGDIGETWGDLDQMRDLEAKFRRGENIAGYECLRRRMDGSAFWASMSSLPISFEADDCTMLWIFDIDDRKRIELALHESEAQLRAVFDNTPVCMNLKDTEGRFIWLNKPYEEWYGLKAEDIIGKTVNDLDLHDDEVDSLTAAEKQALVTGETFESEIRVSRPDGNTYDRILIKFPIKSPAGKTHGLGTVAIDITERKRMEADLVSAKIDAESANRAKSEFLAHMSHDLRTPLNAILGFSEIMKYETFGPIGEELYKEYIQLIHDSGQRLVGMVNDILDLSRIESSEYELAEEPLNVFDAMISSRRRCLPGTTDLVDRAEIRVEADPNAPRLFADDTALSQILDNFLTNAIKYASPNPVISLRWEIEDNGNGLMQVHDNGPGIPAEELNNIMLPFVRGRNAGAGAPEISREIDGVGLGLHIVSRLVDLHQADFMIESAPGEGTTVSVSFPESRILPLD